MKIYDFSVNCGFVWMNEDFGYRCETCCLISGMVLCVPCFTNGNHEGHDYKKYICGVGGVCDCGNDGVLQESGFCSHHGLTKISQRQDPPDSIICRLKVLMPVYLKYFLFVAWTLIGTSQRNLYDDDEVLSNMSFINELLRCGWVTQKIIAEIMIDKAIYMDFMKDFRNSVQYSNYELERQSRLDFILPEQTVGSQHLQHESLLDVFVFVFIKVQFNDNLVYFLNGLLTIDSYKDVFVHSYINHYSRIASHLVGLTKIKYIGQNTIAKSSNRISNISCQLFNIESISLKMVKERNLHYLLVHCLLNIFRPALVPLDIIGHCAIDCGNLNIRYYPWLTSYDVFKYLIDHKSVIDFFITDIEFMKDWITLLKWMQFMNPFKRPTISNVNAVSDIPLNLEANMSVIPMMKVCHHYRSKDDKENVKKIVNIFVATLAEFIGDLIEDSFLMSLSFHLPLMRNVACYLSLALVHQHLPLSELLENINTKKMIRWFDETANVLLGCQEALIGYGSSQGMELWTLAYYYSYHSYRYGLKDMDILASQICATVIPSSAVMYTLTDPTKLLRGIEFSVKSSTGQGNIDIKKQTLALKAWLMNLCLLVDLRNGMNVDDKVILRKEICSILCIQPIKRSDLNDRIPQIPGTFTTTDIDAILNEVAKYTAPTFNQYSGSMQNGLYALKPELWDTDYDPVFQSLRWAYKQDALKALDKYREYYRQKENVSKPNSLWPPYRIPSPLHSELSRLENILHCKDLAYILLCSLNMFLNNDPLVTEDSLTIVVHLIHRSLLIDEASDTLDATGDTHRTRFTDNPYKVNNMRTNIRYNVDFYMEEKKENDSDIVVEEIKCHPVNNQRESILSLLINVHSKLHYRKFPSMKEYNRLVYETFDDYPLFHRHSSDRFQKAKETGLGIDWGDGADFIGHLLDSIVLKDDENSRYIFQFINEIKERTHGLYSNVGSSEHQITMDSTDENQQKAIDRRQKVLSHFKTQQNTFATAHRLDSSDTLIRQESHEMHQCVICQQKNDAIGYKKFLLGIVCRPGALMYMQDKHRSESRDTPAIHRKDYMDKIHLNIPILSDSIIIQTCGHAVHQHCFDEYMAHIIERQGGQGLIHCPLCRRDVHHLTPIRTQEFAKSSSDSFYSFLKDQLTKSFHTKSNYLHKDIIAPDIYIAPWISNEYQACSLLRSQLELELIACLSLPDQYKTITKRCQWPHFISYLRSLNANVIALIKYCNPLLGTSFCGALSVFDRLKCSIYHKLLLTVPSDVFLDFIPYVWPCEDHILHILKACIVMAYVKGMVMIGSKLDQLEYDSFCNLSPDADDFQKQVEYILKRKHYARSQKSFFINIVKYFKNIRKQPLSLEMNQRMYYDAIPNSANNDGCYDSAAIDLVKCLLPLLRIAAVLKLHLLLAEDLPENFPITVADAAENNDLISQFNRLCEYLNLPQPNDPTEKCSAHLARLISTCLKSTMYKNFNDAVNTYINAEFIKAYTEEKEKMELKGTTLNILNVGNELYPPHLIDLPNNYEDFFNAYRNQRFSDDCSHNSLLYGLCLICGKLVCFNCQTFNQHTDTCCMGIGIFIEVSTSIIYVFNYKDGGQWGSVYLDCYGEEDLGLKRGRPMLIDDHRLKLLEQQWLTQSFKNFQTTWPRN